MRFSALSLAFVAALVTAEHHHLHFHHRREINTTCTTSTSVQGYNPSTPVQGLNPSSTSVQGFNPSVYGFQGTGVTQPKAPSSTGIAGVQDTTPTPTLGAASSTITTTTIESTTTETEYFTLYMTKPRELGVVGSDTGPTASGSQLTTTLPVVGADTGPTAAGSEPTAQPTTTLTESTTLTKYITVKRKLSASPTTTASPFIGVLVDNTRGAISSCVPETVTVALSTVTVSQIVTPQIVTIALSTVTVTYTQMSDSPSTTTTGLPQYVVVPPAITPSRNATYGNGTTSTVTPLGTGFLTILKPTTATGGYGVYV